MLSRSGHSLAELLAVILVMGIAGGAVARVLTHHQRHFDDLNLRTRELGRLREGLAVLTTALQDVAPAAGDIYPDEKTTHTSIAIRATAGTFVLCNRPATDSASIDIVAATALSPDPSNPDALPETAWSDGPHSSAARNPLDQPESPVVGDSLLLLDTGPSIAAADDRWSRHRINSVGSADCGTLDPAPHRVTLDPPPPNRLERHAPVTTFRRTNLALYHSNDGAWYLGATECIAGRVPACPAMQPVSGPYAPPGGAGDPSDGGLHIAYLDSTGAPTTDHTRVARIDIHLNPPLSPRTTMTVTPPMASIGFRNRR